MELPAWRGSKGCGCPWTCKCEDSNAIGQGWYGFIEVMSCPGGCLGGGGQPIPTNPEIREKRLQALYAEEMGLEIRKSHENPEVITLYQDFLEEPLSEKAHDLLHTHYLKRVVN